MIGWAPGAWTNHTPVATPVKPEHMRRPVDLVKRYWRGADLIYSANFRPPQVPRFNVAPDPTNHQE